MALRRLPVASGVLLLALGLGACGSSGAHQADGPSAPQLDGGRDGDPATCHAGDPCSGAEACCLGGCRDLSTDPANCGQCARVCESPGTCVEGECRQPLPPPPACPAVVPDDEICVNGWLRDFDNRGSNPYGRETLITDGSVEVWVFDPFQVLTCTAPPCMLTAEAIAGPFYPSPQGTFVLDRDTQGRPIKATGSFIAIGTMNRDGVPHGASDWVECGITAPGQGGITIQGLDVYAVGQSQVDAWETPYPGRLAHGILALMWQYLDIAEPDPTKNRTFIAGVLPDRSPGTIPIGDFYFMTVDRSTIVRGSAGGVDRTTEVGGALLVQEYLSAHSATGGVAPDTGEGIEWEVRQAASVPGLVFVQFFNQQLQ